MGKTHEAKPERILELEAAAGLHLGRRVAQRSDQSQPNVIRRSESRRADPRTGTGHPSRQIRVLLKIGSGRLRITPMTTRQTGRT